MNVPFHLHTVVGDETLHLQRALEGPRLSGEGVYCKKVQDFFEQYYKAPLVILTPSCTASLEMAMILSELKPGDEVVLPSFTFSSTALAVVSRGAVPVFVDIQDKSLNIDPKLIETAITKRTKAILPVHYAGVSADMDAINVVARKYDLDVIEDAAQALFAICNDEPVGNRGSLSTLSFHDTKNITCGEGGALIVFDPKLIERAHVVRDKGTNRRKFINGQVDKYTWVDEGSSFLMSELQAAFLYAQLQQGAKVTQRRLQIWQKYFDALSPLASENHFRVPSFAANNFGNGHIFYLRLPSEELRENLRQFLFERGITAISHYQPLHSSPAGQRFGRAHGPMKVTEETVVQLLRLPLFFGMTDLQLNHVIETVQLWCRRGS